MKRPAETVSGLWSLAGLPAEALPYLASSGSDPVFPSSFPVGTASQTTIAAAALAACVVGHARGVAGVCDGHAVTGHGTFLRVRGRARLVFPRELQRMNDAEILSQGPSEARR